MKSKYHSEKSKHCCFCGRKLIFKTLLDGSAEEYCKSCDYVFFDTPSPAVIVAVIERDRVLLTRSVGWEHPYWGLIAGHLKSSENAEEAVIREVCEEIGLEISDLEILGTFLRPDRHRNLLMIGFTAKANSVSIRKSEELEKATWFSLYETLPLRPNSIANQLIKQILSRMETKSEKKNN